VSTRDRRLAASQVLPPTGAACFPPPRGTRVRRKRPVPSLERCRTERGGPARCHPPRCSAMTASRQATDTSSPAAKPAATPGVSVGSRVTSASRRWWPRPGTPAGRCGRPWPPERASARGWPGGTHCQGAMRARCQSPCRATATVRGCRPASLGSSAPVPATQATLLAGQMAMPCSLPMTRQGARRWPGRSSKGGLATPGHLPRTMSHDSTTECACAEKRNDTHVDTHHHAADNTGDLAPTLPNGLSWSND
jgi:hypothetical protein